MDDLSLYHLVTLMLFITPVKKYCIALCQYIVSVCVNARSPFRREL